MSELISGKEVICIDDKDANFLKYGDMYLVKDVCYGGTHITLESGFGYMGGESTYSANRFELHEKDELNDTTVSNTL